VRLEDPFFGIPVLRFAGGTLIALGGVSLLDSFARFALQGLGTPAPVFPTRHLVVTGLYRYVRNPMSVAVVSAILGQGLLFGNVTLLEYGAAVWLLFHIFVLACARHVAGLVAFGQHLAVESELVAVPGGRIEDDAVEAHSIAFGSLSMTWRSQEGFSCHAISGPPAGTGMISSLPS